ncbi:MAG: threonine/serine exporter family protein [Clostridia bacterium]|nr:threonine/serine exporter family protein [Clostridia bacterium]
MTAEEQRVCMELLQLAGQIIMVSGGETYRVEETITRMGAALGLGEVGCFAVPSGIMISFRLADGTAEAVVKRVRPGSTDLSRVDRVNGISRLLEAGKITMPEALEQLQAIRDEPSSGRWLPLAAAICAGGFALMFGGGIPDFLVAFAVAGLAQMLLGLLTGRMHMQSLAAAFLGSMVETLLPMLTALLWPVIRPETVIAGALMPLLPGLAMTKAVQDTLRGDMLSGTSHGVQALLTAALVAGGTLVASAIFRLLTGGAAG